MRYIVTAPFRPKGSGGPKTKVGDELELTDQQARVFKALRLVKDAARGPFLPLPEDSVGTYLRRDLVAAPPAPARKVAAKKTTRTYTRRNAE